MGDLPAEAAAMIDDGWKWVPDNVEATDEIGFYVTIAAIAAVLVARWMGWLTAQ